MAFGRQIYLMLWKNSILQRRRICVSIFELVIPLFFVYILVFIRRAIDSTPVMGATHFEARRVGAVMTGPGVIGYTPPGAEVDIVMNYVRELYTSHLLSTIIESKDFLLPVPVDGSWVPRDLELQDFESKNISQPGQVHGNSSRRDLELEDFESKNFSQPGQVDENSSGWDRELLDFVKTELRSFKDEKTMEDFCKSYINNIRVCIRFLNVNDGVNGSLPKNFRYAIRPQTPDYVTWNTDRTYRKAETDTPRPDFNYEIKTPILAIQRFLGAALIKYWSSKVGVPEDRWNYVVWTRRMAYPPYENDPMILVVQRTLPTILVLSLLLSVIINTKNLVYEKEKKLKESMKLMGLKLSAHRISWFITFCVYLIPTMGIYALVLCAPLSKGGSILQKSDVSLVFTFLVVYGVGTISFSFMISSLVQKANAASAVSGIAFFLSFTPENYLNRNYQDLTRRTKLTFSLLTNCAMIFGANIIGQHEGTGVGAKWSNIHHPATVDDDISLLDCMIMLMLDSVLHFIVFWYLDNVWPGEFGVPKPYSFCFMKSYWFGSEKSADLFKVESEEGHRIRFEEEPENLKAGISIQKLTKVYRHDVVVKSLSLTMYEGQIFVLLGHNGAGKTTTMSMLTGFIPPTSGSAIVNGYDIKKNIDGVRSSLGLCPQHDILFEALTVKEHLLFFARLKGATFTDAEMEIDPLLTEVGLLEKKNEFSARLSGGQKRKLSVAIALIAGSKVLILDEPSSGMDPAARRQTWTALQNHREGRTILLTTHYMDEADVLGDRIAIMAEGVVKCCGTSMFLKKLYGAGYHLVIVKKPSCVVEKITEVVTSHISTAKLETIINAEVTYLLPEKETANFPTLFTVLDMDKDRLGISGFGTSATTLEEVFLKVGETAYDDDDDDDGDKQNQEENNNQDNIEGGTEDGIRTPPNADFVSIIYEDGVVVGKISSVEPSKEVISDNINVQQDTYTGMYDMSGNFVETKLVLEYEKNVGCALEISKMWGILYKKALHTWRNRTITMAQLFLPVLMAIISLSPSSPKAGKKEPPLTLDLSPFESTIVPTTVGFDMVDDSKKLEKLYGEQFGSDHEVKSFNLSEHDTYDNYTLDEASTMGIGTFNKRVIVGLELKADLNGTIHAFSRYNGQPLHSEPIGLNYLMNALLQHYLDSSYSLQAVLHPLPTVAPEDQPGDGTDGFNLALLISFGTALITTLFVHFLIKERQVGSKHLQVVSGVDPICYWIPTFLWDLVTYLIPNMFIFLVFLYYGTKAFTGGNRSLIYMLMLFMYGWAELPYLYLLQYLFKQPPTGVIVIMTINVLSGLVGLLVVMILKIPELKLRDTADMLETIFTIFFPNYSIAQSIFNVHSNYKINQLCQNFTCEPELPHPCCKDTCMDNCFNYTTHYLAFEKPGIGINILTFFLTGIVCFILVIFIDNNMLQRIGYILNNLSLRYPFLLNVCPRSQFDDVINNDNVLEESDVSEERVRISGSTPQQLGRTDSLILVNLFKKYGQLTAVDHIFLGIPKQECFGLLGQNGAGKTTIFKMLTGDVMLSGGNAYLDGYDICKHIRKVQSNLGYCPQYDALLDQMTGRETLTMYARLKGVPENRLKDVVNNLMEILMLMPHADKLVGAYSGGNKRKLSTAVSLIGMPQFILLDEPSAGMDPKSRRQFWNVLALVRSFGHTLILTSHSMEECDALCTRLAIMVNGRFVCLGSPQHLKIKFGQGYTLIVKQGLLEDGTRPPIEPLVNYVAEHLPGLNVFDDHQGYLHFQVPDSSVKLANVFGLMEVTKEAFCVQDYSVHQTTLEQVFLTFTRTQARMSAIDFKRCFCGFC